MERTVGKPEALGSLEENMADEVRLGTGEARLKSARACVEGGWGQGAIDGTLYKDQLPSL